MNGINVQIDAERVNKMVAEAILNSAIGTELKKAIDKEVADLGKKSFYDSSNAMGKVVHAEVMRIIDETLQQPAYHDVIVAAVREKMTAEVVTEIVHASWTAIRAKLDSI